MDVCIINIGPKQRRLRLIGGLVALAFAVGVGAWVVAAGSQPAWRLATFPLLWFAAIGIEQWRAKT